jgi:Bacterial archaeo-eukaryotic release factor family 3
MQQVVTKQYADVLEKQTKLPCVSIIMPFEPKMNSSAELKQQLKTAIDKIKIKLLSVYDPQKAVPVISKLLALVNSLNYNTHKRSIAIFVSPLIEKVYYLDILVEEKIIIDDSFEIRDLIYGKKQNHKYLLAELNSKWTKIYIGNTSRFIKIISNVPDFITASKNDLPAKELDLLDKFLQHTDKGLSLLLNAYDLPLFVMGTEKTIKHFKAITRNDKHVVEYIHGNFEKYTESELYKIMEPYVADWKKVFQLNLLHQVEEARTHHKLVAGMKQVWKAAAEKRGKLLIVEKNLVYPSVKGADAKTIYSYEEKIKCAFYIKDAVDDVIEKVLAGGGDVEFTDEGLLKDYENIVLIECYEHS